MVPISMAGMTKLCMTRYDQMKGLCIRSHNFFAVQDGQMAGKLADQMNTTD